LRSYLKEKITGCINLNKLQKITNQFDHTIKQEIKFSFLQKILRKQEIKNNILRKNEERKESTFKSIQVNFESRGVCQ